MQAYFLDISKKTQARKNSKLKQNPEKTQEKIRKNLKNRQLQLSWDSATLNENFIFREKPKVTPKNTIFITKCFQKWEIVGTFLKYSQKLMEKTQNSSKISRKLKPKFQKTQKPATPVELNCRKSVQKISLNIGK